MGKHHQCEYPVGLSKNNYDWRGLYPKCVLIIDHEGPHRDAEGNLDHITVKRSKNA